MNSVTDTQKQATRQQHELLAAVSKALANASKPGMTMNELAKAVGVSRPTLYYHFADKNEIVLKLVEDISTRVSDQIQQLEGQTYRSETERLYALCHDRALLIFEKKYHFQLLVQLDRNLPESLREPTSEMKTQLLDYHEQVIKRGVASGEFFSNDTRLSAFSIIGMVNWSAWWFDPKTQDAKATAAHLARDCVRCLAAPGMSPQQIHKSQEAADAIEAIQRACLTLQKTFES